MPRASRPVAVSRSQLFPPDELSYAPLQLIRQRRLMIKRSYPLIAILLSISGCSLGLWEDSTPQPAITEKVVVELHLSRTSLTQTDYEQYKFMDGRLYKECGLLKGGRPVVQEQDFIDVGGDHLNEVSRAALTLYTRIINSPTLKWEPPGKNVDFFDPGRAFFTIRIDDAKVDVRTSVSALDEPTDKANIEAARLASALRASSESAPCGNRKFYGIE